MMTQIGNNYGYGYAPVSGYRAVDPTLQASALVPTTGGEQVYAPQEEPKKDGGIPWVPIVATAVATTAAVATGNYFKWWGMFGKVADELGEGGVKAAAKAVDDLEKPLVKEATATGTKGVKAVADALNIDHETSTVDEIVKALLNKQHADAVLDLERKQQVATDFVKHKKKVQALNPGFDPTVATNDTVKFGRLPANRKIDNLSAVEELEDIIASSKNPQEVARAQYALDNGDYKLIRLGAQKGTPVYEFVPAPLHSPEVDSVIRLHHAGRATEAQKLAGAKGIVYTPGTGTVVQGTKTVTIAPLGETDILNAVGTSKLVAYDQNGNALSKKELSQILREHDKNGTESGLTIVHNTYTEGGRTIKGQVQVNSSTAKKKASY